MAPLSADRPISSLPMLKVATTMTVADPDVAAVWPLVIQAIQRGDINSDDIGPLLESLQRRSDHDVPGLRFRTEPAGGETIVVASGLDSGRCAAEALVAAVEELRDGAAAAAVAPTAQHDDAEAGHDLLGQLGRFFEQLPATLPTGDDVRGRLSTVSSAVGRIVSDALSADPEAERRTRDQTASLEAVLEQAGDDLARWTEARGDELTRALAEVRDVAPARVAEGLRNLADWLEKRVAATDSAPAASPDIGTRPADDTAAHIDALFASLGKSFGALFAPPVAGAGADAGAGDDDDDEPTSPTPRGPRPPAGDN